jgi:hypothetical protein
MSAWTTKPQAEPRGNTHGSSKNPYFFTPTAEGGCGRRRMWDSYRRRRRRNTKPLSESNARLDGSGTEATRNPK